MGRRDAREELFKLVFESLLKEETTKDVLDQYRTREEKLENKNDIEFLERYMVGIAEKESEIKKIIDEKITGWSFERIGNVEKTLLVCAVYELKYESTPYEIVVNEVVELAKIYGDEKTAEFVNGVLAKIINQ